MKSESGNYETIIRRCKDGTWTVHMRTVAIEDYPAMGLMAAQGYRILDEARSMAKDWLAEYDANNGDDDDE